MRGDETFDGYVLRHNRYSPALGQAAQTIPGCTRDGGTVRGQSDAIETAVSYLIKEKGLNASAFSGLGLVLPKPLEPFSDGDPRLRTYQREAVHFLRTTKRAILADDMGLGKTASAISAAISFLTPKRVLIVCPSYVRGVWHNPHDGGELGKWATLLATAAPVIVPSEVFECKGVKPEADGAPLAGFDFVICHYDILHAWADILCSWNPKIVIFDECHYLMNPETRRTKAAMQVSKHSEYVWGLSGTPMTSRPRDLWGILSTICPQRFGDNFFRFGLRYCGAYKEQVTPDKAVWKFDGKSNLKELHRRLSHFMLRRTKTDVALELPPKTRQVIRCDIGVGKKRVVEPIFEDGAALHAMLASAADAKLKEHAVPLIRSHLDAGAKVVVFSYRRGVADYLANECGGAVIHGGIPQVRRTKTIHELRQKDGASLLCATIDAAGTGIDLSYADVAVFVELTYEPHELLQAESRLHRFGAQNPVLIQYLIARGTADELVADIVITKLATLETAVGGFSEAGLSAGLQENEESIMADLYRSLGL